jgi:thiamine monophosphate synthase
MLLSTENAIGLIRTGVSYIAVFLAVVALADTRSTVIQDRGKDL